MQILQLVLGHQEARRGVAMPALPATKRQGPSNHHRTDPELNTFKPLANPLLILSDRPEDHSGLARVARDIASLACTLPQFRVAVMGRGSEGLRKFPWTTYSYPESAGWGQGNIERVIADFFGDDRGIILSNWDLSRLGWLAGPQYTSKEQADAFGSGRNWDLWGYIPVDSTGPDGKTLGIETAQIAAGFDRIAAASEWGSDVLRASGREDADWYPHGIFTETFKPVADAKKLLGWDGITVGCVMTNQARKDWPVAFQCASLLKQEYGNKFRFWVHTDTMIRYWNLYALATDYGITDCMVVTLELNDQQMAMRYSACDCTILPSGGEGFSFPTAESLSCGTPCVVPDYAAAPELVPENCRVAPVTYRIDTLFNCRRAVLSGYGFAVTTKEWINDIKIDPEKRSGLRESVSHLGWDRLQGIWKRWLLEGIR